MMNCFDNGRVDFPQRLLNCLKKGDNDEAKFILRSIQNFKNLTDSSGSTLLHYSARHCNSTMVQLLIDVGSNINAVDNANFTPLMLAVRNGDVQIARILLENNADIFTKERTVRLAFQQTINSLLIPRKQHHQRILEMLFEKVFRSLSGENISQLLSTGDALEKFAYVVFGNVALAELILEEGFPMNYQEPIRAFTALHCAIIFAKIDNAKLLIKYGADVTAVNNLRLSPLRYYTWDFESLDKDSNVLELLLRGNTGLYLSNQWGFNEAEYLLKWGNKKTVETVLRSGFDIVVSYNGRRGNTDEKYLAKITELLLQHATGNEILICQFVIQLSFLSSRTLLLNSIFADCALFGARRAPQLTKLILHEVESEDTFRAHFDLCTQQLEKMKSVVVYGTVTLFMLLTQRQDKLAAYARNQDLIVAFNNVMTIATEMEPYYFNTLQKRVADAIERAEFETRVVSIVRALTGLHGDGYHAIVCNIISYLDHRDLNNLCRTESLW